MTRQTVYGLVFDVSATAPAAERAQGRLITIHPTGEAAAQYFQQAWPEHRKIYGDPTLPAQGRRMLPLSVITEASCYGTAYQFADVQKLISKAQADGKAAYEIRHDAAASRPELYGNEANKLIAQSEQVFVSAQPSPPRARRAQRHEPK